MPRPSVCQCVLRPSVCYGPVYATAECLPVCAMVQCVPWPSVCTAQCVPVCVSVCHGPACAMGQYLPWSMAQQPHTQQHWPEYRAARMCACTRTSGSMCTHLQGLPAPDELRLPVHALVTLEALLQHRSSVGWAGAAAHKAQGLS